MYKFRIGMLTLVFFSSGRLNAKYVVPKWFQSPATGEYVGVSINDVDSLTARHTALAAALLSYYIAMPKNVSKDGATVVSANSPLANETPALQSVCSLHDTVHVKFQVTRWERHADGHCWIAISADEGKEQHCTLEIAVQEQSFADDRGWMSDYKINMSLPEFNFDYETGLKSCTQENGTDETSIYTARTGIRKDKDIVECDRLVTINRDGVTGIVQNDTDPLKKIKKKEELKRLADTWECRESSFFFAPDIGARYLFSLITEILEERKMCDGKTYRNVRNYIENNACHSAFSDIE